MKGKGHTKGESIADAIAKALKNTEPDGPVKRQELPAVTSWAQQFHDSLVANFNREYNVDGTVSEEDAIVMFKYLSRLRPCAVVEDIEGEDTIVFVIDSESDFNMFTSVLQAAQTRMKELAGAARVAAQETLNLIARLREECPEAGDLALVKGTSEAETGNLLDLLAIKSRAVVEAMLAYSGQKKEFDPAIVNAAKQFHRMAEEGDPEAFRKSLESLDN